MRQMSGKRLAAGALAGLLAVTAGCQAVGGLDVQQAVVNSAAVQSGQASLTVTVSAQKSPAATDEQAKRIDKLNPIVISVPDIRMQDRKHISYQGELQTSRGAIPFQAYLDGSRFLAQAEGSKQPVALDLGAQLAKALSGNADAMMQPVLAALGARLADNSDKLLPEALALLAAHAGNPRAISVTTAEATVHGEALTLQKLHAELSGSELRALASQAAADLIADEQAMKAFLGDVYDLVAPELLNGGKDSGISPLAAMVLGNKEQAVQFIYGYVKERGAAMADALLADAKLAQEQARLELDVYVDQDLRARKAELTAVLPLPGNADSADNGIAALRIQASGESWNLNKPVTAAAISAPGNAAGADGWNASRLLGSLEPQSAAYKWLREDIRITRKQLRMTMGEQAGQEPSDGASPFIKNGVTLVPVRYVSEHLDADIAWDGKLRQVTIQDVLSGALIVLTIDSKAASVNGSAAELEQAAVIVGGSTYVPVRFIAERLGAKVGWDDVSRTVSITRE